MAGDRRTRNKARMRQRISDAATVLFFEHGFDEVSVSAVAEAADVARPTVFAHFPRKEDLLLDQFDDTLEDLVAAVLHRPEEDSAIAAVGRWVGDRARRQAPPVGIHAGFAPFWRVVAGSRALQVRARELCDIAERRLAGAIADTSGDEPSLSAALIVASVRSVHLQAVRELLDGAPAPSPEAHGRRLLAVLEGVEAGVRSLASRPGLMPADPEQRSPR